MHEAFLHYIWQFQYFDHRELRTTEGEKVEIFKPGLLNSNAGPDFQNAKVGIDGMEWAGSVEIHTKASGWYDHHHDQDPAYENVILHVVWENDKSVARSDQSPLPTLELKGRVEDTLIRHYGTLLNNPSVIPCKRYLNNVDDVIKQSMIERSAIQRLQTKASQILQLLKTNQGDWQETVFLVMARHFGFMVNGDPFEQLARAVTYRKLRKLNGHLLKTEAILFGQAGFLDIPQGDEYYQKLRLEFGLLTRKYDLESVRLARRQWRFLRLRPANFPTVRIAQFASFLFHQKTLSPEIFVTKDLRELRRIVSTPVSEYWRQHYRFNKQVKTRVPDMGISGTDNILINAVSPLLIAFGKYHDHQHVMDKATEILQRLPAENNSVIRTWHDLGFVIGNAFETQGALELYNEFCQRRNCLNCVIGSSLLKPIPSV
jgi:Protein of unknown function (DUF2851)